MRPPAFFAVSVLLAAVPGVGQSQAHPARSTVRPGSELRILLADSTVVRGRFGALQESAVSLNVIVRPSVTNAELVPRWIALDSILGAWVRTGTRWKLGAGVGAAVGAVLVTTGFYIGLQSQDPSSCSPGCWAAVTGTGALMGGVLGLLVGHQFVVWRLVSF